MNAINKFLTALQLGYSILVSPALFLAEKYVPSLHRILVAPLMSGPFKGRLIDQIWIEIDALHKGFLDQEAFISNVASRMQESFKEGELDCYLQAADERNESLDITLKRCIGFLPLKWWYLKLHFMAPGNVHELHRHRAVISAQVILRGALRAEQFNLVAADDKCRVWLQPIQVEHRNGFQTLLSTDKYCNVHGFEPKLCGAVRFQFYLRGHTPFWSRFPKRGRHYVQLSGKTDASGLVMGQLGRKGRAGES